MTTLTNLRETLLASLGPTQFSLVNTRLTLGIGVNLKAVRPEDDADWIVINKVKRALAEMGVKA